jgi:hypothetical protein
MQGFRADAPRKELGALGWFNGRFPFDIVYDCWGAPGGLLRGLFQYDYRADGMRIRPHLPPEITYYRQKWPVMFGDTEVYITVTGTGTVTSAMANGNECNLSEGWIELKMDESSDQMTVEIIRGDAVPRDTWKPDAAPALVMPEDPSFWQAPDGADADERHVEMKKVYAFYQELVKAGSQDSYEAHQARASLELLLARHERMQMLQEKTLVIPDLDPVPPCDQEKVSLHYYEKARIIAGGLVDRLKGYSVWEERSDPSIVELARKTGLVP